MMTCHLTDLLHEHENESAIFIVISFQQIIYWKYNPFGTSVATADFASSSLARGSKKKK